MFHQSLTPIGDSLALSFIVGILPVVAVLVMLGVLRRPAWQASLVGLVVGLLLAVICWRMPVGLALDSVAAGIVFALWPVMWIAFNALVLYNVAVSSGRFDAFRRWILENLPADRRVVLIVVGFCFGALLEGIAGFGSTIAISSSLLILVGWEPLEALTYTLIFDTAPVAYGALGIPVTVLGQVTHQPDTLLGAMVGRQLPFLALLLPFYVMAVFQFGTSNFYDYRLTDVFASLGSLLITIGFLQVWRPAPDERFVAASPGSIAQAGGARALGAAAPPRAGRAR